MFHQQVLDFIIASCNLLLCGSAVECIVQRLDGRVVATVLKLRCEQEQSCRQCEQEGSVSRVYKLHGSVLYVSGGYSPSVGSLTAT
jgi:hypothetical protein